MLVIRGLIFVPFGLYGGLWRYTGVWDLSRDRPRGLHEQRGAVPPGLSAAWPSRLSQVDRDHGVVAVDLVSWGRASQPADRSGRAESTPGQRVLILGAGDAGEMIVREMRRGGGYHPVGFIDDNPRKVGRTIHGVTVLGTRDELRSVIEATEPQEVLIAIPSANAAEIRSLVQHLEAFKLPITTLPDLKELVNGRVAVKQIRPLAIEDLLPRSPISLNVEDVRRLVRGKRVLVTGAGGSIGSELCRQIAALAPASLVLFERYENSLYAIATIWPIVSRGCRSARPSETSPTPIASNRCFPSTARSSSFTPRRTSMCRSWKRTRARPSRTMSPARERLPMPRVVTGSSASSSSPPTRRPTRRV